MADIRPKDLVPTATAPAGDDYVMLDGATEGTRKILGRAATHYTATGTGQSSGR